MPNLVPGSTITLRCLGALDGPRFLDGRTRDTTVGLAPVAYLPFTGSRWQVIADGASNHLILKCLGTIDGPRYLDGRTESGSVALAPSTDGIYSGTHWEAIDDGPNHVTLKCLGSIDGPRFLDGRTSDGSVGLAPETGGIYSGTHWELLAPPKDPEIDIWYVEPNIFVSGTHFTPNGIVTLSYSWRAPDAVAGAWEPFDVTADNDGHFEAPAVMPSSSPTIIYVNALDVVTHVLIQRNKQ